MPCSTTDSGSVPSSTLWKSGGYPSATRRMRCKGAPAVWARGNVEAVRTARVSGLMRVCSAPVPATQLRGHRGSAGDPHCTEACSVGQTADAGSQGELCSCSSLQDHEILTHPRLEHLSKVAENWDAHLAVAG